MFCCYSIVLNRSNLGAGSNLRNEEFFILFLFQSLDYDVCENKVYCKDEERHGTKVNVYTGSHLLICFIVIINLRISNGI